MPRSIADEIRAWASREFRQSAVSRNTECYNQVQEAVERLAGADWAQEAIPDAPTNGSPQAGE